MPPSNRQALFDCFMDFIAHLVDLVTSDFTVIQHGMARGVRQKDNIRLFLTVQIEGLTRKACLAYTAFGKQYVRLGAFVVDILMAEAVAAFARIALTNFCRSPAVQKFPPLPAGTPCIRRMLSSSHGCTSFSE